MVDIPGEHLEAGLDQFTLVSRGRRTGLDERRLLVAVNTVDIVTLVVGVTFPLARGDGLSRLGTIQGMAAVGSRDGCLRHGGCVKCADASRMSLGRGGEICLRSRPVAIRGGAGGIAVAVAVAVRSSCRVVARLSCLNLTSSDCVDWCNSQEEKNHPVPATSCPEMQRPVMEEATAPR